MKACGMSVHNPDVDTLMLGRFTQDESSYIKQAGKYSTYFDMGETWDSIRKQYALTPDDTFELFNRPVLDDAIDSGKSIWFSHDPRGTTGFLGDEWECIKKRLSLTDGNLKQQGGLWYVS